MKISELDATITSLNTEHNDLDIVVDIPEFGEYGCDFTVEYEGETFDGFDEVYPARLVIKPKRQNA